MPSTLKRKKANPAVSKINAAPSVDSAEDESEATPAPRPDLLSTLRNQFGPALGAKPQSEKPKPKSAVDQSKEDYENFLTEMGDILGAPSS